MHFSIPTPIPRNANGAVGQHGIVIRYAQMDAAQSHGAGGRQQPRHALDHAAGIDGIVFGEGAQLQFGQAAFVQIAFDVLVSGERDG